MSYIFAWMSIRLTTIRAVHGHHHVYLLLMRSHLLVCNVDKLLLCYLSTSISNSLRDSNTFILVRVYVSSLLNRFIAIGSTNSRQNLIDL